jgi:hypothetical protein
MGVTVGTYGDNTAAGWTVVTASEPSGEGTAHVGAGTRKVYVSSSGNNANPGTELLPKQTITAGFAALRDGSPDWLLLKKGDSWNEALSNPIKRGKSDTEPMLVSSYGTGARPLILMDNLSSFATFTATSSAPSPVAANGNNICWIGLHFYDRTRDPDAAQFSLARASAGGITALRHAATGWDLWLVEDCKFEYLSEAVKSSGNAPLPYARNQTIIRRNVFSRLYGGTTDGGGYISGEVGYTVTPETIEENVFYYCGWYDHATLVSAGVGFRNKFNHDLYLEKNPPGQPSYGALIRGNISIKPSAQWFKCAGYRAFDNLFISDTTGGFMSYSPTNSLSAPPYYFINNVCLHKHHMSDSYTIPGQGGAAPGILLTGPQTGSVVSNNVFAHHQVSQATASPQVRLDTNGLGYPQNIEVTNNIFYKISPSAAYQVLGTATMIPDRSVSGDIVDVSGTNPGIFPFPERTIKTYNTLLGGAAATIADATDEFALFCLDRSKDDWSEELTAPYINDYFRVGFGLISEPELDPPTVTTEAAQSVSFNSAILPGTVVDDGGAVITQRGVAYGLTADPNVDDDTVLLSAGSLGAFSVQATGLASEETYHFRAFAENSEGLVYGTDEDFTTPAAPQVVATVTTADPLPVVSKYWMRLAGEVVSAGTGTISERGFVKSTAGTPTTADDKHVIAGTIGTMSVNVLVDPGSTWYIRAFATTEDGTAYGNETIVTVRFSNAVSLGLEIRRP